MRVERDRWTPLPEPAPDDQVGRRNHAVGLDEGLRNLVPLDLKTQSFQERGDDFCGAAAITRGIVRRNFHDLGEEARLSLGALAHEIANCGLDLGHRAASFSAGEVSKPSTRIPS